MLRMILAIIFAILAMPQLMAGEKQLISFDAKLIGRQPNSRYCQIDSQNNTISISGGAPEAQASWQHLVLPFPFPAPAGKTFIINGEAQASGMSGAFRIAARLINASGKSIGYEGVVITKNQDWTSFSKEFTVPDNAAKLELYLVGIKLAADSRVSIKELVVEEK